MAYNIEELTSQVKDILVYSQGYYAKDLVYVDQLLAKWEANKRRFIDAFGSLIYESPIKCMVAADYSTKFNELYAFCDEIEDNFLLSEPNAAALSDFIWWAGESFYDNTVPKDFTFTDEETGLEVRIPAGSKLIKSFKNFIIDKENLVTIQNRASQLIQASEPVTGTLCFSVHPLDFLSISDNTYNWSTCHNLADGDYRMGNLSYMIDNSTFICYIRGEDGVVLPVFPENILWNSKRWRTLIHCNINNNIFFMGRHYPFYQKYLDDVIRINIEKLFTNIKHLTSWNQEEPIYREDKTAFADGYYDFFGKATMKHELVNINPHSLNYNDILHSSVSLAPMCYDIGDFDGDFPTVDIGEKIPCLHCGNEIVTSSSNVFCETCFNKLYFGALYEHTYCSECGKTIESHEKEFIKENRIRKTLCKTCYRKNIYNKYMGNLIDVKHFD